MGEAKKQPSYLYGMEREYVACLFFFIIKYCDKTYQTSWNWINLSKGTYEYLQKIFWVMCFKLFF